MSTGNFIALAACVAVALLVSGASGAVDRKKLFDNPAVNMLPFREFNPNTNVTDISTFAEITTLMRSDDALYVIYLYDSLDINSIRLGPTVETVAEQLRGFAQVVAMDSREPALQWVLNAWNVQVVPSLRVLLPRRHARQSLGEKNPVNQIGGIKQTVEFSGKDFLPETIKKWALSQLSTQPYIEKLDDRALQSFEQAVKQPGNAIVVLFTDKDSTSQLYKALALNFFQRAAFAEFVKAKSSKTVKAFGVKSFPTLMLFAPAQNGAEAKPIVYDGKLNIEDLTTFINPYVASKEDKIKQLLEREEKLIVKEKKRGMHPIPPLTDIEDWNNRVLGNKKGFVAVLFCDTSAESGRTLARTLAAAKKKIGRSNSVQGYFVVDRTKQSEVAAFFSGGEEGVDRLSFINVKKGLFSVFSGAEGFEASAISDFVRGGVAKDAKSFELEGMPNFIDESLQ